MKFQQGKFIVAAASVLTAGALLAQGAAKQIRVTVRSEDEPRSGKAAAGVERTSQHINITLQNASPNAVEGAIVRYYIFAEDATRDHNITLAKKGERNVNIAPSGSMTITSEVATVEFVKAHPGGTKQKPVMVKASGEKITGYGAQVLKDNVVIGEYFTSLDLTNHLDATVDAPEKGKPAAPPPAQPKKKS